MPQKEVVLFHFIHVKFSSPWYGFVNAISKVHDFWNSWGYNEYGMFDLPQGTFLRFIHSNIWNPIGIAPTTAFTIISHLGSFPEVSVVYGRYGMPQRSYP